MYTHKVQLCLPLSHPAAAIWAEPESGSWHAPSINRRVDRETKESLPFGLVVFYPSIFKEGQNGQGKRNQF